MSKVLSFVFLSAFAFSFSSHIVYAMDPPSVDPASSRRIQRYATDLYFVAEEVDETNRKPWIDYLNKQAELVSQEARKREYIRNQEQHSPDTVISQKHKYSEDFLHCMYDGLLNGKRSLDKYYKPDPNSTMWVNYAYSSKNSPSTFYTEAFFSRIEMSYVSGTTKAAPFSTHMGISRNYEYLLASDREKEAETPSSDGDHPQHQKISIPLHEFGAFHTLSVYPDKLYMITSPLPTMGGLILNALPKGSAWLGEVEWIETQYNNENANIFLGFSWEMVRVKSYIDAMYPQAADIIEYNKSWSPVKVCGGDYNNSPYAFECNCEKLNCIHMEPNPNFKFTLQDTDKKTILELTPKEIEREYRWFFHPPYLTDLRKYPYVIADLKVLGAHLPIAK